MGWQQHLDLSDRRRRREKKPKPHTRFLKESLDPLENNVGKSVVNPREAFRGLVASDDLFILDEGGEMKEDLKTLGSCTRPCQNLDSLSGHELAPE